MTELDKALSQIEKQFGKGAIQRLGSEDTADVEAIPTGSMTLDLALGVGGLPRGRVVELYGTESGGKTTLALHVAAEAQKMGGTVAFIDAEHALDPVYARAIGVNTDDLLVSQPDTGEQALEIAEHLIRSGEVMVLIVDSVAALVPRAEIDGDMGQSHVGLQARLMSQAMRKLVGITYSTNTLALFINQIREKVGVIYGSPETQPGGRALKFYSSVRLDIRRKETIKDATDSTGIRSKVKIVKNKVAAPFKEAEFDIMFGEGISKEGSLLDAATDLGVVKKSGAWYSFGEEQIGQGREKSKEYLKENPEMFEEISSRVRGEAIQRRIDATRGKKEDA